MEIVLTTDLESALPASIDFNFDQLKAEVEAGLQKYSGLVFTEETLPKAREDRAALNKLKTALNDKRIEVKNACLAPYQPFAEKISELEGMVNAPINAIDKQIKAFSDQKKQDKYNSILQFYRSNVKDLVELIPIEKVLPEKWANTNTSIKKINEDMLQQITKARNDIGIIKAMSLPCTDQMLDAYLKTLDMSAALTEKKNYEDRQKALAILKENEKKKAAVMPAPTPPSPPASKALKSSDAVHFGGAVTAFGDIKAEAAVEVKAYDFRCFMSDTQRQALRQFLIDNNIEYRKIPVDDEGRVIAWQSKTA